MKIKKAIIASLVLYAIIFVVASGAMLVFPKDSTNFKISMPITVAVVTLLVSRYFYFKDVASDDPFTDGLTLGLLFVLVFFIIDVPMMVYGFASAQGWLYFTQLSIMIGYFFLIIIPIIAAYIK